MPVSSEMKEHLANSNTSLAVFLKITATDGTILRVWNGTRNKILNGEWFYAHPLAPSQLKQTNNLSPDNMEAVVIYSGLFNAATLRSRKWLGARVEYAVYDYKNFSLGYAERRVGIFGETEVGKYSAKPELRSLSAKLSQQTGFTFQEFCNVVKFADTRCGVDLNGWTVDGFKIKTTAQIIAPVLNRQQFSVEFSEPVIRGLRGRYYSDNTFSTLVTERNDGNINFDYGDGAPVPGVSENGFANRWEGFITAPFSENFTFEAEHDDGVRVWVNGDLIIDQWVDGPGTHTGIKVMTANVAVPFKVEFYDLVSVAKIKMRWSSPSQTAQIIPLSAFTPPSGTTVPSNLYERGGLRFTSGNNEGLETQILTNSGNALTLYLPTYYTPQIGDELELITGCNRKINICRDRYANGERNRSFYPLAGRGKLTFPN